MLNGVDIGQVVAAAVARAGYGPYLVQPLLQSMVLHVMTMDPVTPERVSALAEELLPGAVEAHRQDQVERIAAQTMGLERLPISGTRH